MKKNTLLVATGLYPPDIGGPATYTVLLERELPARSIAVDTVAFTSVRHLPKVVRHVVYTWQLWRASKGASVLLALDPVSVGLSALLVARLRRVPFLLRLGGDYAWEQGVQRSGVTVTLDEYSKARQDAPLLVRGLHYLQRFVARRAGTIIVPSAYLKQIVCSWGITPKKITVIHSAVSVPEITKTKEEARRRLGLEGFVLVTAARLTPWKGVAALIASVAALRTQGVEVSLYIAGDGTQRASLQAQVEALALEDAVHFLGRLDKNDLQTYLVAADALALNTSYEGLSHQLLEAMLLKVPIITTPIGGNPELIHNGATGFLVPFNDETAWVAAIKKVYEHPQVADTYAAAALQHAAENFSPAASLDKTAALIISYGH